MIVILFGGYSTCEVLHGNITVDTGWLDCTESFSYELIEEFKKGKTNDKN